jgi:hypothetical protein
MEGCSLLCLAGVTSVKFQGHTIIRDCKVILSLLVFCYTLTYVLCL